MSPSATPQAVNCPTFSPLPLDHSLTLPGIYDHHAEHSPNHPVFAYTDENGKSSTVTYLEASQNFHSIAHSVVSKHLDAVKEVNPVVAILAASGASIVFLVVILIFSIDTLSYAYTMLAIMSLGATAFPLSLRNTAAITAHLLKTTGSTMVFVSSDETMQKLAQQAVDSLANEGIQVHIVPMATPADWAVRAASDIPLRSKDMDEDNVAVILHSSGQLSLSKSFFSFSTGTTALPKPIRITKKGLRNLSNIPCVLLITSEN